MSKGISIRIIRGSGCEEVLGWKCINLHGMNLEILVVNTGRETIELKSEVEFMGESDRDRVDYLYPHGVHPLGPEQGMSFYCSYDEQRLQNFSHLQIREADSNRIFRAAITGREEKAVLQE